MYYTDSIVLNDMKFKMACCDYNDKTVKRVEVKWCIDTWNRFIKAMGSRKVISHLELYWLGHTNIVFL